MATVAELLMVITGKNSTESAMRAVNKDLDVLGKNVEDVNLKSRGMESSFRKALDTIADAAGEAERTLNGVADMAAFASEQLGLNVGPLEEVARGYAGLAGGIEGVLAGAPEFLNMVKGLPTQIATVVTGTWAHVTALYAQAAAFIAANAPMILIIGSIALLAAGVILAIKYWDEIVEKVPFLGTAFEAVKGVIVPIMDTLWGAITAVYNWVKDNWPLIAAIISGPFAPLVLLATDAFGIRSALTGAFEELWTTVSGWGTNVLGFFTGLPGQLATGFGDGFGFLWDAFKASVNEIIGAWNDLSFSLPQVDLGPLGKFGGWTINTPDMPFLAAGVRGFGGGWAVVGENGPELARLPAGTDVFSNRESRAMLGGGDVTLNVYALDSASVRDWLRRGGADEIAHALRERGAFA